MAALCHVNVHNTTLGEYEMITRAWAKANGAETLPPPPSEDEFDALVEAVRKRDGR